MYECPNDCGSNRFLQKVVQSRSVVVTERGEVVQSDGVGDLDVQEHRCEECGAEVETDD
jgi:DNA-directed RNA polymerase subunit RPC12/RpoP